MKTTTVRKLQDFVGKICSVFTGPIAREFTGEQFSDYFVGLVEFVDEDGIWTRHPVNNCQNYFPLNSILGICEEEVLYPDDPEDAKVIEEYSKVMIPSAPSPSTKSFVDIDMLAKLAAEAK